MNVAFTRCGQSASDHALRLRSTVYVQVQKLLLHWFVPTIVDYSNENATTIIIMIRSQYKQVDNKAGHDSSKSIYEFYWFLTIAVLYLGLVRNHFWGHHCTLFYTLADIALYLFKSRLFKLTSAAAHTWHLDEISRSEESLRWLVNLSLLKLDLA